MAFNIWERWPWTSFQNLNLDWLMKAVKEAVTKAEEASASVGQFDARITANTDEIEQLGIDISAISSPAHVLVSSELEARYRGNLVTGSQLLAMMQTHGDLPYVEYNGEVYMLYSASSAGDLRFSMAHTTRLGDVTLRHITIPAQSSNVAYSITNIDGGGGGSSGNVFAVTITQQAGEYVSDHTYAEIYSQMQAGRIPVLLVAQGNNYTTCPMAGSGSREINNQTVSYVEFVDTDWLLSGSQMTVGSWRINSDGTVDRMAPYKHIATIDNVFDNAVIYTGPQELTAAEQAQARENIGITGSGGSGPLVLTVTSENNVFSVDKTAAEIRANLYNLRLRYGLNEGVDINSYEVYGSPPTHSIRFVVVDPNTTSTSYIEFILQLYQTGYIPSDPSQDIVTVTHNLITHNISGGSLPDPTSAAAGDFLRLDAQKNAVWTDGNKPRVPIAASSASIPALSPNTLYVFTGDATALNITLAQPANNNVENEYHFIFNSGSTPTTLTLPNTIRQSDGFTVEANHVYEVSILENNMTAQGWAVTP